MVTIIFLQKSELKILKYIKKRGSVSELELRQKFKSFETDKYYISSLIQTRDLNEEESEMRRIQYYSSRDESIPVGLQEPYEDDIESNPYYITYTLSRAGYEYFYQKRHDAWLFWFPYGITTLIAATSVIVQLINLFK